MSHPETMANRVLDKIPVLVPEDLLLLDRIVWARRGMVVEEPLDGADAQLLLIPGKRAVITISSKINNHQRKRFSIAHELGHMEMHRNEIKVNICTREDITDTAKTSPFILEQEANQFASCFLMPARFVKEYYQETSPSMDAVRKVANGFDVSLTAAALRFIDFSTEPIAVVFSRAGRIEWFKPTQDFLDTDAFVNVGETVGENTNASRIFRGQSTTDEWYKARAFAWLRKGDIRDDAVIKEWSVNMMNYESVLSLLWIDEELFDDDYLY
jgi:hypothetical protein